MFCSLCVKKNTYRPLKTDMTLKFLAKGGYSSFYRKGRETKTGYLMYKTLI
jgi:hypothetical protein